MKALNFITSFRARLLLVLAALLALTLGVQFYLNELARQQAARMLAEQEQALAAGYAIAGESLSYTTRLTELVRERDLTLLQPERGRVINILIVDNDDQIEDSLDPAYNPQGTGSARRYHRASEVLRSIPTVNVSRSIEGIAQTDTPLLQVGEPRAFRFPLITTEGTTYIIVVLGSATALRDGSLWSTVRPLLPTLVVLLIALLVTAFLVWRFTQPIQALSQAARRVAAGDFDFRVPAAKRRDEMGALASVFNEMIARLGRMRDLEARLHQVERSAVVGRLASAIAHEIRNPLNYINLTLDHLRAAYAPEDEQKRQVFARLTGQVKIEVGRINTRISEFLSYTRPAHLELRPLDLRALVEDVLRLVEVQAAESGIETRLEQQGPLPPVSGDEQSLRSLFTNLIINGMQAVDGEGGRLTITLSEEEGSVRADISDTGRGIPPENISQIFEPYFSTKDTGTGLGLAIVKKSVDDHGGTISVASRQGEGTTFTIKLPIESVTGDK